LLRKILKYFFLGLVLLLVFLSAALLAMRFAIQGREVHVPRLTGLTPAEAERVANSTGLVLSVETAFIAPAARRARSFRSRLRPTPRYDAAGRSAWRQAWEHSTPRYRTSSAKASTPRELT
jgi:hypothetical protein